MKTSVRIIQILVGVLFIISGLVKANDPLGLSYKMQEFFELWHSGLSNGHFFLKGILIPFLDFLHGHSLFLSTVMISLEIITGIALLIGWKKKLILYLLLILIVFFTFLTGYAYLSGKFTNCGCFGDCLPITPLTSFMKDLALLVLIILLIAGQRYIQPLFNSSFRTGILVVSLLFSIVLQWYVLNYLPVVDCLPFKKGNNLAEQMKPPPGAVQDSFAIQYIYEKDGKRYEFTPETLPQDFTTYKYIDRTTKLVRKGNAEPAIKGFVMSGPTEVDSTQFVLDQPLAVLLFLQDDDNINEWINDFQQIDAYAHQRNIPVYVASSMPERISEDFSKYNVNAQIFGCDFTVIRTAARTSPTIYILKKGTVVNKYGYRRLSAAGDELKKL